jgi:hypothetical protein
MFVHSSSCARVSVYPLRRTWRSSTVCCGGWEDPVDVEICLCGIPAGPQVGKEGRGHVDRAPKLKPMPTEVFYGHGPRKSPTRHRRVDHDVHDCASLSPPCEGCHIFSPRHVRSCGHSTRRRPWRRSHRALARQVRKGKAAGLVSRFTASILPIPTPPRYHRGLSWRSFMIALP